MTEVEALYTEHTNGRTLPEWRSRPNIKYGVDERDDRASQMSRMSRMKLHTATDSAMSNVSGSVGGWGKLTPRASNAHRGNGLSGQDSPLYDANEEEEEEEESESEGNNGAFGVVIDDDDNAGAFGLVSPSTPAKNSEDVNDQNESEESGSDDGFDPFQFGPTDD